ncbi:Receptor homology region, transmembrane domain- and RING domain-containing protein 2 [Smittium culicis]|uniref:Receptor homology region, transmembrane domain-and RING domain-containing protein 2 n=1 Tax=Smittium culicis TaxID=133412 RepID=A0A1R1WZ84_9FUNG|nr:Receptor homology region, transmembrane domain- and RING domain-containing protein 2 [Smittium culicis]
MGQSQSTPSRNDSLSQSQNNSDYSSDSSDSPASSSTSENNDKPRAKIAKTSSNTINNFYSDDHDFDQGLSTKSDIHPGLNLDKNSSSPDTSHKSQKLLSKKRKRSNSSSKKNLNISKEFNKSLLTTNQSTTDDGSTSSSNEFIDCSLASGNDLNPNTLHDSSITSEENLPSTADIPELDLSEPSLPCDSTAAVQEETTTQEFQTEVTEDFSNTDVTTSETFTSESFQSSDPSDVPNSLLAAAVARSVISATRNEFTRNRSLFTLQNQNSTNANNISEPLTNQNIWPNLQGQTAIDLENGISRFILDILNNRGTANSDSTDSIAASVDLSGPSDHTNEESNNNNASNARSEPAPGPNPNSLFSGYENSLGRILDESNRPPNAPNGASYIDVPGSYQFRVFPILAHLLQTSDTNRNPSSDESLNPRNSENTENYTPDSAPLPTATEPTTQTNSDTDNNSSTQGPSLSDQRDVLRRIIRRQNARNQHVPVIIVGIRNRTSDPQAPPPDQSSRTDTTTSSPPIPETQNRGVRSILSSIYDRVSRLIPSLSSESIIPQNSNTTPTPATQSAAPNNNSNTDLPILPEPSTNDSGDQSSTSSRQPHSGLIVYVFATSFELSHPLLLSFMVNLLFPNLMNTSSDSFLADANNGQLYEDFMAFAELLGQARSPVASMADVEAQLPKYTYHLESLKNNYKEKLSENTAEDSHSQDSVDTKENTPDLQNIEQIVSQSNNDSASLKSDKQINSPEDTIECGIKNGEEMVGIGRIQSESGDTFVRLLSAEKCLVCMEEFGIGDSLRVLSCRHGFHADCVADWITKGANICPVCRSEAVKPSNSATEA